MAPIISFACYLEKPEVPLLEKCPYAEFFWSVFHCIWTEYLSVFSQNKYEYEHFSRSTPQTSFPNDRFFIAHRKVVFIVRIVRREDSFKETNARHREKSR